MRTALGTHTHTHTHKRIYVCVCIRRARWTSFITNRLPDDSVANVIFPHRHLPHQSPTVGQPYVPSSPHHTRRQQHPHHPLSSYEITYLVVRPTGPLLLCLFSRLLSFVLAIFFVPRSSDVFLNKNPPFFRWNICHAVRGARNSSLRPHPISVL